MPKEKKQKRDENELKQLIQIRKYKKPKHSGIYILPLLLFNKSYKLITIGIYNRVFHFVLNDYDSKCSNCGEIHKNKLAAEECCLMEGKF